MNDLQVVSRSLNFLDGWAKANEVFSSEETQSSVVKKWCRPQLGWMKINVDGTIFSDRGVMGAVMGDHNGHFLGGLAKPFMHKTTSALVEALGVREMLSWIRDRGRSKVIVEMDCLQIVQAIKRNEEQLSIFGSIILDCLDLLATLSDVKVEFVSRLVNSIAHNLTRGRVLILVCMFGD